MRKVVLFFLFIGGVCTAEKACAALKIVNNSTVTQLQIDFGKNNLQDFTAGLVHIRNMAPFHTNDIISVEPFGQSFQGLPIIVLSKSTGRVMCNVSSYKGDKKVPIITVTSPTSCTIE